MKTEEIKEQVDEELYRLSKGFKALNLDYQKGVLKTAQGLLRIQRKYKEMITDNTRYVDFSLKSKNG
jgi:bifunctional ADP-heptose synthase (sugar kinase/adenylyltransferase)